MSDLAVYFIAATVSAAAWALLRVAVNIAKARAARTPQKTDDALWQDIGEAIEAVKPTKPRIKK